MNVKGIISASYTALSKLSKNRLLRALQSLRDKYIKLEEKNNELEAENERLKEELKKKKIKSVNKNANKPSSKQPEWDKKGVGNDGKGKKKGKGRGKKPRKGAGNRPKNVEPDRTEKATVDRCSLCDKDLSVTFFRWQFYATFLLEYWSGYPNMGNTLPYNRFCSTSR